MLKAPLNPNQPTNQPALTFGMREIVTVLVGLKVVFLVKLHYSTSYTVQQIHTRSNQKTVID